MEKEYLGTATYSPEDDKLRMYPFTRFDPEDYDKLKKLGFSWAPKQELFFAIWKPSREDLLIEMCGEIEDEDKSLVERAEERAERFEGYSNKRENEANQVKDAVKALADNIPFGQPILVGHHSERRARKDAERIQNGMSKAVKLWETSKYWSDRAAGALHHAKYKELPTVRARRIKKIEAEIRSMIAAYTPKNPNQILNQEPWNCPICNKIFCKEHSEAKQPIPHVWTGHARGGSWTPVNSLESIKKYYERWINHCENRLVYEKAMLNESGGLVTSQKTLEKGGACRCWASPRNGWSYIQKVNKVSVTVLDNWGNGGSNFTRNIPFDKVKAMMTVAEIQEAKEQGILIEMESKIGFMLQENVNIEKPVSTQKPDHTEFDDMKDSLKSGVKVVSAPQLFPTPPEIADLIMDYAEIKPGERVLEPSAGTGNLLKAMPSDCESIAVELNSQLSANLVAFDEKWPHLQCTYVCKDFLECEKIGMFDKICMNPPFENGSDIKHIKHAMTFLKPGGRLVALCANGPRQQEQLQPLADHWEVLPEGSFKQAGTNVNVALLVINN